MNFKNVVWFIKAMLLLLLKMKQQQRVAIKCKENSEKKFESQMGFESMTLLDLVGCSNHRATGHSMVSKCQFASRCHIRAYQVAVNQTQKWVY